MVYGGLAYIEFLSDPTESVPNFVRVEFLRLHTDTVKCYTDRAAASLYELEAVRSHETNENLPVCNGDGKGTGSYVRLTCTSQRETLGNVVRSDCRPLL